MSRREERGTGALRGDVARLCKLYLSSYTDLLCVFCPSSHAHLYEASSDIRSTKAEDLFNIANSDDTTSRLGAFLQTLAEDERYPGTKVQGKDRAARIQIRRIAFAEAFDVAKNAEDLEDGGEFSELLNNELLEGPPADRLGHYLEGGHNVDFDEEFGLNLVFYLMKRKIKAEVPDDEYGEYFYENNVFTRALLTLRTVR